MEKNKIDRKIKAIKKQPFTFLVYEAYKKIPLTHPQFLWNMSTLLDKYWFSELPGIFVIR